MFTLDLTKYENVIRFDRNRRAEYDQYIMNAIETDTQEVLASSCFPISFDGEEKAFEALRVMIHNCYPSLIVDYGHNLDSIEHAASTLLNRLEIEGREDEYHETLTMPMSAFRGRSHSTNKLLFKMPENVTVFFHKIDGQEAYDRDLERFTAKEQELKELFISDVLEKSGLSKELFVFVTKTVTTQSRSHYMADVIKAVHEYLEIVHAS